MQHPQPTLTYQRCQESNQLRTRPYISLAHHSKTMASTSRRQSRWGPPRDSATASTTLTDLNPNKFAIETPVTAEQAEAYALQVRIAEITQKLETDDVIPADHTRRSPSPAPEYDDSGRRTNTRPRRYRERLSAERQSLIRQAAQLIPNYRPPPAGVSLPYAAAAPPPPITEKLYIPVKDFPEVNFIGQILGPRGRSLAETATKSGGAKIVLRGRGSVKEGRHRRGHRRGRGRDGESDHYHNSMSEPLHCLITADSQHKVDKAKAMLQDTIEMATTTPEHANSRKQEQLRALAIVNGTFRDDEGLLRGGGTLGREEEEHRRSGVICRVCGGNGHVARDCVDRKLESNAHGGTGEGGLAKTPPWRKARQLHAAHVAGDTMEDIMYSSFLAEVCPRR